MDAARAEGMHVGFYYSHAFDWEDPNAPGNDWDYHNPGGDKGLFGGVNWYNAHPELVPRIEKYVYGKAIPELKELIAKYHPDILWFDTPSKLPFYEQAAIVKAVREADPDVVINGRAARKRRESWATIWIQATGRKSCGLRQATGRQFRRRMSPMGTISWTRA